MNTDSSATLLAIARDRVIVLDGAMGTALQNLQLPISDYDGCENCSEVLVLTRPDVIGDIHRSFLSVGCDAVLTNTFGANQVVLAEFGLADRAREINQRAATIAREACDESATPARPRFVIGSVGPGTRLPTLGQATWDELLDSYHEQVRGLLEGGVDAVLIETCQDILQAKCAVVAASDAMRHLGVDVPIFCTVTIESTGTMLVGTDIAAASVTLEAYPQVAGIGMNCATGPEQMSEHIHYLGAHCDRLLIVQPNAGLPQLVDGKPHYALTPEELARWLVEFVEVDGVNIVGGCCGTTPEHLAAVVDALEGCRPRARQVTPTPAVSSVYQAVPLRQDASCLTIGERTNANGSKMFRELLAVDDIDGMVQMAREQVNAGCHLLDVCTACVGRDEVRDMTTIVKRFATDVTAPLVIDSTDVRVIEAALKLAGGKCVINSVNLEDGEDKAVAVCRLAQRYGAALIALLIDEEGMAKTCTRKVEVARRIYDLAVHRQGLRPTDLLIDPLTFTICTGQEGDRRLALETLEALKLIKETCPGVHTLLGVSNVSYGLKPPVRRVINSVFLHHARERGLDAAIVHASGVVPLFKIDGRHRSLTEDLIFARQRSDYDPLQTLLRDFEDVAVVSDRETEPDQSVEERLKLRVVNGERRGLIEDLDEAMLTHRPLAIVNDILLDGMKTVGDLFGAGQTQLPFVLQSAETMKAAVEYLEPNLDQAETANKGTIILATVRGDVHDVGKNLVDIILSNNGYTVHNLGIKQTISHIIEVCEAFDADVIGMSGLLVQSTLVMRENLQVLNERGINIPVLLGGAALTRKYVEEELRPLYNGPLFYAKDALAGLFLLDELAIAKSTKHSERRDRVLSGAAERVCASEVDPPAGSSGSLAPPPESTTGHWSDSSITQPRNETDCGHQPARSSAPAETCGSPGRETPRYVPPKSNISRDEPVPAPPFWGSRVLERVEPSVVLAYLNEKSLFQLQWQYRKNRRQPEEYQRYLDEEVRPILRSLLERCEEEDILQLKAVYGYWPAQADGDSLIVFDPAARDRQIARFEFPRMGKPPYWCISDFFRPINDSVQDVVAFTIVTAGARITKVEREWLAADRYQDYLHVHGLGVEMAEALAEYVHKRIREECGIADHDTAEPRELFKQRYQGSRYSFGYPACPRLEDQVKLWPILEPERIGVSLTETFQLEPEQTTTALVTHHQQAKYFNVR